jgi:hypothetical protein
VPQEIERVGEGVCHSRFSKLPPEERVIPLKHSNCKILVCLPISTETERGGVLGGRGQGDRGGEGGWPDRWK